MKKILISAMIALSAVSAYAEPDYLNDYEILDIECPQASKEIWNERYLGSVSKQVIAWQLEQMKAFGTVATREQVKAYENMLMRPVVYKILKKHKCKTSR